MEKETFPANLPSAGTLPKMAPTARIGPLKSGARNSFGSSPASQGPKQLGYLLLLFQAQLAWIGNRAARTRAVT